MLNAQLWHAFLFPCASVGKRAGREITAVLNFKRCSKLPRNFIFLSKTYKSIHSPSLPFATIEYFLSIWWVGEIFFAPPELKYVFKFIGHLYWLFHKLSIYIFWLLFLFASLSLSSWFGGYKYFYYFKVSFCLNSLDFNSQKLVFFYYKF